MTYKPLSIVTGLLASASSTRDNGSTPAVVKTRYAGGPESLTDLFITQGADIVCVVGEPRLSTTRTLQAIPHYEDYEVPVTLRAINRFSGSNLISSAPHTLGKFLDSYLKLLEVEGVAHGSDYELTATTGQGSVKRHAGMDVQEMQINIKVRLMV